MRSVQDKIRRIKATEVSDAVTELFLDANQRPGDDLLEVLKDAREKETSSVAQSVLDVIEQNCKCANENSLPICQDTGMAVLFCEIGQLVHIEGDTLENAINTGVKKAYVDGKLRCSVVKDPFYNRKNTEDNTPAIIHIRTVPGDRLKMTAAPKGFGSENMSAIRMFTPSASEEDLISFVTDTVHRAGSNPCPPITVGVGIGSDFEGCAMLAKHALTRDLRDGNSNPEYFELEKKMLNSINSLGIGPQGFGGKTTALSVKIETGPTHIAGLPVAVNINCHVVRHKTTVL